MVADAVVGVAVDVAQVRAIQLGELSVELLLGLLAALLWHSSQTLSRLRVRDGGQARLQASAGALRPRAPPRADLVFDGRACGALRSRFAAAPGAAARGRRRATPTAGSRRPRCAR